MGGGRPWERSDAEPPDLAVLSILAGADGGARLPVTREAPSPAESAGLVGHVVGGRYQLVRMLGDGGMGAVYKAADQVLRRFVAIKMLHPATSQNPAAGDRFQREARAAAAIGHPNIIDILDFGSDGNRAFMVMEYLRGRSLSQLLANEGQKVSVAPAKPPVGLTDRIGATSTPAMDRSISARSVARASSSAVPSGVDRMRSRSSW